MGTVAWRGGPVLGLPLVLVLGFVLAGCGSTSGPQLGGNYRAGYHPGHPMYKVGPPYQINGVWYYPKVDYDYEENGTASWYGPGFDQKVTANGEIYDMNQLSAAHKTLPLPSVVEVTNLQNGRALQLRVNDRGPYVGDRVIDVSRRAAQLLGFEGTGTAPVRVKILKEPSIRAAKPARSASPRRYAPPAPSLPRRPTSNGSPVPSRRCRPGPPFRPRPRGRARSSRRIGLPSSSRNGRPKSSRRRCRPSRRPGPRRSPRPRRPPHPRPRHAIIFRPSSARPTPRCTIRRSPLRRWRQARAGSMFRLARSLSLRMRNGFALGSPRWGASRSCRARGPAQRSTR